MIQHSGNTWRDVSHLIPSPPPSAAPPVPVLSTTILQLELLLGEPALDLAAISAVLLTDMGAVIQLLRASAADAPRPEDRTLRVGDCIASLGADTWFNAVSALPYIRERNSRLADAAEHARAIAELAKTIASEFGLCPEESYIVGLLHEIHNLPGILGWKSDTHTSNLEQQLWQPETDFLPQPVAAALRETLDPRTPSVWRRLLKDAHHLAPLPPRENPGESKDEISRTRLPVPARPRASESLPRASAFTPFFKPLQFVPLPPYFQPPAAVLLT